MAIAIFRNISIATLFACSSAGGIAYAEDNVSWRDIDFGSCPLNANLRVADGGSTNGYMALQGCAARIVVAPRAPISTTPDVARIIGVKEDKPKKADRRRGKTALAEPPPGTRRVSAMLDRPVKIAGFMPDFDSHIQATAAAHRIDPLFLHAIIGTESTYRASALSHAGARGLMQVMPATAQLVARRGGLDYSQSRLTGDWLYNSRLGADYLRGLAEEFDGNVIMMSAGYNAGPGRPRSWKNAYGDPIRGDIDIVDWIEMIPFNETRNYVMRVSESLPV